MPSLPACRKEIQHFNNLHFRISLERSYLTTRAAEYPSMFCVSFETPVVEIIVQPVHERSSIRQLQRVSCRSAVQICRSISDDLFVFVCTTCLSPRFVSTTYLYDASLLHIYIYIYT